MGDCPVMNAARPCAANVIDLHAHLTLLQRHCDPVPLFRRDQVVGVLRVIAEVNLDPLDLAVVFRTGGTVVVADRRAEVAADIGLVVQGEDDRLGPLDTSFAVGYPGQ